MAAHHVEAGSSSPYRPLDTSADEIRVIVLEAGKFNDPVRCHVKYTKLSDEPYEPYETISYCWGEPADRATVEIDGGSISVPASAELILRYLRQPDATRALWIDAVCIQQSYPEERNHQVAIMDRIYKCGQRNIVWLGQEDESTPAALHAVSTVLGDIRRDTDDFANYSTTVYNSSGNPKSLQTGFGIEVDLKPLRSLFIRPWFRRLWVVQEAAFAQFNICRLGRYEFPLLDILRVAYWTLHKGNILDESLAGNFTEYLEAASVIAEFADRRFGLVNRVGRLQMSVITKMLRDFDCSDARDYIYGALGLFRHFGASGQTQKAAVLLAKSQDDPPRNSSKSTMRFVKISHTASLRSLINPDYTKTIQQVFCDAAKFSIQSEPYLHVLMRVNHRIDASEENKMPSWVPMYHLSFITPSLLTSHFKASNGFITRLAELPSEENNTIKLFGVPVRLQSDDRIQAVSGYFSSADEAREIIEEILALVQRLDKVPSPNQLSKDLGFVLLGGQNAESSRALDDDAADMELFMALLKIMPVGQIYSSFGSSATDELLLRRAARYARGFLVAMVSRRFFVMTSGLIGIGPQTTRPGDVVAVLYGGFTPFVLRPHGDEHELVGQCYVHGIMDGEIIRRHEAEGGRDTIFCLR